MSEPPYGPPPGEIPNSPSNYPRPGMGGSGNRRYKPYIDWDVITESFSLMWPKFGTWFSAGAIFGLILLAFIAAGAGLYFAVVGFDFESLVFSYTTQLVLQAVIYGVLILGYAIIGPLLAGMCLMALKARRGQEYGLTDLFSPFSRFFDFALASFTIYLMVLVATFCCYIPGLVIGALTMFILPVMVDKGYSFGEAFTYSLDLLKKHWLMATLMYLVIGILAGIGAIACIIGVFFTLPLYYVIPALLYDNFAVADEPGFTMNPVSQNPA